MPMTPSPLDQEDEPLTVALISDTHGWLDPSTASAFEGAHLILHAGDIGQAHVITDLEEIARTVAVRGNIDGGTLRFLPEEVIEDVGPLRIAMRHIAGSPKRPNRATRELLATQRPDIIVVGHSHIPVVSRVHGALWINPGAAGREGFHEQRFAALLHITRWSGKISMDRVHFGPRVESYETSYGPGPGEDA